jgi:hypothetical protein
MGYVGRSGKHGIISCQICCPFFLAKLFLEILTLTPGFQLRLCRLVVRDRADTELGLALRPRGHRHRPAHHGRLVRRVLRPRIYQK